MILDDLYNFYQLKAAEPEREVPRPGWSMVGVGWEFRIDRDGNLVSVLPLGSSDGKIKRRPMEVPEQSTRSSGIKPYFLCDNASYFLGMDQKRGTEKLESSRDLHQLVLEGVEDAGAKAVLRFFERENLGQIDEKTVEELAGGGLIVFRYLPDSSYVHERPSVQDAWKNYLGSLRSADNVQCAITGERSNPAQLFPMVSGFPGAQSSGASLISFNQDSFCSYGKGTEDQAQNASISEGAAASVGAALRYLSQSPAHRVGIGDTQVLFWTDGVDQAGLDILSLFLDSDGLKNRVKEDETALAQIEERLKRIRSGLGTVAIDTEVNYYVLGLAPNAARLSVRFFERGSMGNLEKRFQQYLSDTEIVSWDGVTSESPRSIRSYVNQTAAFGKAENVPSVLLSSTTSAMLKGTAFPMALFQQLLSRTRADKGFSGSGGSGYDAMNLRVAMLKACLIRLARQRGDSKLERSITVALNEENENVGYLLGRLFAALEKVQKEAVPGANATIRDRYIGAASSTPARVFPQLLKMSQHHISKAEYGGASDRKIQEILGRIDSVSGFPATLSYEDQGQFFIGYYQQKANFYVPKVAQSDSEANEGEE